MRVLFDYQTFQVQNFGGISRYFAELISRLQDKHEIEIGIKFSDNQYLKDNKNIFIRPVVDQRHEFLKRVEFYGKGRIFNLLRRINPSKYYDCYQFNREYSIELLKKQDFDVFHPTYYDDYFLEFIGNKPFVVTIHDMSYEKFPEFFPIDDQTAFLKKRIGQEASHIISVSENTKKDIINFWGIDEEKISVIYHGINSVENTDLPNIDIPNDYLLFVGARNVYKNFLFFIHSVAEILIRRNINLICTGKPFSNEEMELFRYLNIYNKVFHHFANDSEMAYLYKNAIAFIFPSLNEGFGIPILEAFANDCPVLLSNTSCFPEIAGHAALYFDPKSQFEIQDNINRLLALHALRKSLIVKGRKQLGSFSWDKAVLETNDVYERVL